MSELDRERREMAAVLQRPGVRPDRSLRCTRRTFIHRSCETGAATVAQTFAWWPLLNTIDVAYAAEPPFKFAWISDTHLYPRSLNTRFVDKVIRAADVLAELENLRMRIGGHPARANNFALNIAHRCKP